MTEFTIDIPQSRAVLDALARAPQIAQDAQQAVMEPLGESYLVALKRETPKGRGEERGVRLSESYQVSEIYNPAGSLYRITNVSPKLQFVIKGRGPVVAKKARALRFVIDGKIIFRKRVGATKPNNFPSRVEAEMRPQIDDASRQIAARIAEGLTP